MNQIRPFLDSWAPRMLSILRIVAGGFMMQHGAQKLFGWLGAEYTPDVMSQIWVGGVIEFFGGLLVAIGLCTRCAAFILSGTMAVAYFQMHAANGFWPVVNKGELAAIYCFVYLYLVFAGGGPWSVDSLLKKPNRG